MKIRTRVMILFLLSILLSTLLAVSAITVFGHRAYYDKANESGKQALRAVSIMTEQMMSDVRSEINVLFWNTMLQEKLEELELHAMTPEIRYTLQDTLSSVLLSEDAISSILFYDNDGNCCYSYRDGVMVKSELSVEKADWYADVCAADGEWIYETDGGGIASYAGDNHNVITMIRTVKLKSDYTVCGIIMVNIDADTLQERFASLIGENEIMYLLSGQSILYTSNHNGELPEHLTEVSSLLPNESLRIMDGGPTLIYLKTNLKESNWQIVSETAIDSGLEINVGLIAVVLVGNIALLLFCWVLISRTVNRPLEDMAQALSTSNGVPENFVVDKMATDEISTLKIAYNQMLESIRELMEKTYEEEKSIQRGELELILSQVSPHFLYNTLDTISGMILSGDENHSFEMVQLLGKFYRNNLNGGQQFVTIKEELETVKSYLNILNTRYGGSIRAEYTLPKNIEDKKILKLLLQPIVENAVHHGLRPKGVDGRIAITVEDQDEELVFSVWDNGIGMSQEKVQEILQSEKEMTPGFGIFSIRQRIRLYYGAAGSLTIESCEGEWTKVSIRIPA